MNQLASSHDVEVITFGCRLNAAESEHMLSLAQQSNMHDTVIINSCAVTREAERQTRQTIRRIRRHRPQTRIIVTGCAAQIHPESFLAMPEVDTVIGNRDKLDPQTWQHQSQCDPYQQDLNAIKTAISDITAPTVHDLEPVSSTQGRARAILQVQTGCNHRCTFCIIPYGRGPSRSAPLGSVVEHARCLVEAGYQEIVLSGVDLTAYGHDMLKGMCLGDMINRLLYLVPGLARLRLSSIDVAELDPVFERLVAEEPRLMPHFHLSLQAGNDMILKRMRRRHDRAMAEKLCRRLQSLRPDLTLGADLIAGFPTETEAMFHHSLDMVKTCGLIYLHVFPFSPRPGTPADRMPQVPISVRRERAGRLRAAGAEALRQHLANRPCQPETVLIESIDQQNCWTRAEDFTRLRLPPGPLLTPGNLQRARSIQPQNDYLEAIPL